MVLVNFGRFDNSTEIPLKIEKQMDVAMDRVKCITYIYNIVNI